MMRNVMAAKLGYGLMIVGLLLSLYGLLGGATAQVWIIVLGVAVAAGGVGLLLRQGRAPL